MKEENETLVNETFNTIALFESSVKAMLNTQSKNDIIENEINLFPTDFHFAQYNLEKLDTDRQNIIFILSEIELNLKNLNLEINSLSEKTNIIYGLSIIKNLKDLKMRFFMTSEDFEKLREHLHNYKEKYSKKNIYDILLVENGASLNKQFYIDHLNIINLKKTIKKSLEIALSTIQPLLSNLRITKTILAEISDINEDNLLNHFEKMQEELSSILKKYNNDIKKISDQHDIQYKNLILDIEKLENSSILITNQVDNSLKKMNDLNLSIQKFDSNFFIEIDKKTKNIDNNFNIKIVEYEKKFQQVHDKLLEDENAIKNAHSAFIETVQNAGIYKLTENYQKKSETEKTEYQRYRDFTVYAMIGAIGSTILMFLIAWGEQAFTGNNTNYLFLVARLTLSVMFFVLAFYLSKQAAKHYECYQENHRTYLQLAALEPFIANMKPEEQLAIRKQLIPTFFNQNADGKFASKADEVDISTNMYNLLSQTLNILSEKKDSKTSTNGTEASVASK